MSVPKQLPTQLQPFSEAIAQPSIRSQVIVTQYRGEKLFFPSTWVEEVLLFARHRIVEVPFYQKPIMGVISHHGHLIPIVYPLSEERAVQASIGPQENIRAIRLSSQVRDFSGIGILIDKILGTQPQKEAENEANLKQFNPEKLANKSFQPVRWRSRL